MFFLQREAKEQLKMGLASLPAPKNDYEIVVPEDEAGLNADQMEHSHVSLQSFI